MNSNPCGSCTFCCKNIPSHRQNPEDFELDHNYDCNKLCENGCSVYENRPQSCRDYECLYTLNYFPELKNPFDNGIVAIPLISTYTQQKKLLVKSISNNFDENQLSILEEWCIQHNIDLFFKDEAYSTVESMINLLRTTDILDRWEQKSFYSKLIKLQQNFPILSYMGNVFKEKRMYDLCYDVSVKLSKLAKTEEEIRVAENNRRYAVIETARSREAIPLLEKQYNKTKDPKVLLDLAMAYSQQSKHETATKIYKELIKDPNCDEKLKQKCEFNLSGHYFRKGDIQEGLRRYLKIGTDLGVWNLGSHPFTEKSPLYKMKEWNGDLSCSVPILCIGVAGIGDEIINLRFVKQLQQKGMNVKYYSLARIGESSSRSDLLDVFDRSGISVLMRDEDLFNLGEFVWVKTQMLPAILNSSIEDLDIGKYIFSNEEYVKKWKEKTKSNKKLKIGIRWQGNIEYEQDLNRSIDLKYLYSKLKNIDADFYSLQTKGSYDNICDFPGMINNENELTCWDETLGLIDNMDFIITSCTSVAHASAAMGVKTFVLTPAIEYYVWTTDHKEIDKTKSYWYGNHVKVFRQKEALRWEKPIDELIDYIEYYET
jgi:hypothetical protein